jgi:membrane associated rhomboid family serine protease
MLPFRDYNPSRTFPLVTISLIAVNIAVYLYMFSLQLQGEHVINAFYYRASVIPAVFLPVRVRLPVPPLDPTWLTIFTAMFMHGSVVHIAGNMLYLWIFGNNVEDAMGPFRFLVFYLLAGIIATAVYIASAYYTYTTTGNLRAITTPSLGASGAIAGVLGAYLVRFPRAQVDTCVFFFFITIVRLPAIIVLAFWFILQLFSGVAALGNAGQGAGGGVAWWAHIGGFLAGVLLVTLFAKPAKTGYNAYYD